MNRWSTIFVVLGLAWSNFAVAQKKCGTNASSHVSHQDRLSLKEKVKKSTNRPRDIYSIPVVVHVLWRLPEQNISEAQIQSQIEVLNEDFRRMNTNYAHTPDVFKALSEDSEIEFCLSLQDPFGNATNGITRRQVTEKDIGSGANYYQTLNGGQDAWEVSRYLNVWVCEPGGDLFGFATLPGQANPSSSDGIVIDPKYFGREGLATTSYPHHLGRTLTHEVGHYLGLIHPWGANGSNCEDDDEIDDTPPQEEGTDGCPTYPYRDICSPRSPGVMYCNFMDYSDDSCLTMFTRQQVQVMHSTLNNFRSQLISGYGCSPVSTKDNSKHSWSIHPNPVQDQLCLEGQVKSSLRIRIISSHGVAIDRIVDFDNNSCLDISPLTKGAYWMSIEKGNFKEIIKFIKL